MKQGLLQETINNIKAIRRFNERRNEMENESPKERPENHCPPPYGGTVHSYITDKYTEHLQGINAKLRELNDRIAIISVSMMSLTTHAEKLFAQLEELKNDKSRHDPTDDGCGTDGRDLPSAGYGDSVPQMLAEQREGNATALSEH